MMTMQATPSARSLPRVDRVYTKTVSGRHEVSQRSAGLTSRQRTALIMLDGQRDARVLESLMPADQVAPILAALIALDLITSETPSAAPAASASPLAAIKAELVHAAEVYLGVMAADVVARVRQADDAPQLLRVLGHWHMALQDSKHGKAAAQALLEKTRATLA
jgi:hypothetical protein